MHLKSSFMYFYIISQTIRKTCSCFCIAQTKITTTAQNEKFISLKDGIKEHFPFTPGLRYAAVNRGTTHGNVRSRYGSRKGLNSSTVQKYFSYFKKKLQLRIEGIKVTRQTLTMNDAQYVPRRLGRTSQPPEERITTKPEVDKILKMPMIEGRCNVPN